MKLGQLQSCTANNNEVISDSSRRFQHDRNKIYGLCYFKI